VIQRQRQPKRPERHWRSQYRTLVFPAIHRDQKEKKENQQRVKRVRYWIRFSRFCYRRFLDRNEFHSADDGAQGDLQFLHGESHADAAARTQSERRVRVRVHVVLVFRRPSVRWAQSESIGHSKQKAKAKELPVGIELFRLVVVFLGIVQRKRGDADECALLDGQSVVRNGLVALAFKSKGITIRNSINRSILSKIIFHFGTFQLRN